MNPRPVLGLFRGNVAEIGTPTCTAHTSNSLTITGSVRWYKGDATWGYAYKAEGADNFTHVSNSSQDITATKSGLSAGTTYTIKLYVKYQGVYQYGPSITQATDEAAPAETPTT